MMRGATHQAALSAGLAQMELCLQTAQSISAEWPELAYLYLQTWLRDVAQEGVPFSAEDFTEAARGAGLSPHDDRAFGAVFLRAARNGLIRRSATLFRRRRGHGSPTLGWEATRKGGQK